MKRISFILAVALAAVAGGGALDSASAQTTAHSSRVAKVELRHTSDGNVLVDAEGFTLFRFTKDPLRKNTCLGNEQCSATWPALSTSGKPTAGPGVSSSLLSTIVLGNGTRQVTYAGHPLYRYALARERAETGYVGVTQFGGAWLAVNAAGRFVR